MLASPVDGEANSSGEGSGVSAADLVGEDVVEAEPSSDSFPEEIAIIAALSGTLLGGCRRLSRRPWCGVMYVPLSSEALPASAERGVAERGMRAAPSLSFASSPMEEEEEESGETSAAEVGAARPLRPLRALPFRVRRWCLPAGAAKLSSLSSTCDPPLPLATTPAAAAAGVRAEATTLGQAESSAGALLAVERGVAASHHLLHCRCHRQFREQVQAP
mmetsp:Transcript_4105/g.8795  ORF Transcript_4105/g.8795 Transcript_4105/m.8795 type:complete len:218 (+) Transcript_4105:233-886(+)